MLGLTIVASGCDWLNDDPSIKPDTQSTDTQSTAPTILEVTPPPTPLPPLPTATNTAVPQPTPTYDPGIADWTVLVYMDADNNLEAAGLLDLNEMEAAGISENVNVVVQVDRAVGETDAHGDWTDTRRYLIRGDDSDEIVSEPLASLGERNMGDPQELADFVVWGMRTYPANRYALIIWDHGAGWNGIAFDDDTAEFGLPDHISLPDLKGALDMALSQSNAAKLDVIGFDACLMGQLDVFQAVQPFADYAVGSEELTPGLGWDYTALLRGLYDTPGMDGAGLSRRMVADFMAFYQQSAEDDFVTMAAVDTAQLSRVSAAVEQLAHQITAVPAEVAGAVGDARSGASSFARVYADAYENYAAVDLVHFASILAQRSANEQVVAAAEGVKTAVFNTVIAHEAGSGIKNSHGIAIYFPRNAKFYSETYAQLTSLPVWDQFLNTYHRAGLSTLPPPEMRIDNVFRNVIGVQNPAYMDFEIVGRDIENVAIFGGAVAENGRLRLLEYDNLIPEPTILADGSALHEWRDGIHEDFYIWRTMVTYLYDSFDNGDFVVMWPTDYSSPLFTVQGQYRRADTGDTFPANLVFHNTTGALTRVWSYQSTDSTGVAELFPQAGDIFQIDSLYIDKDHNLLREPGPELTFDDAGQLFFDRRPLPNGSYFFGFEVENVAGAIARETLDFTIDNSTFTPGSVAYLDPYLGFQFLYPENWFQPIYKDGLLYTTAHDTLTELQITIYPNLAPTVDAATLKTQTLQQFGNVAVLFADEAQVVRQPVLRTAYGYEEAADGPHTGIFFTFVRDGTGFVVDVDGLEVDEAATVTAVSQIIDTWQFAPAEFGLQLGEWATVDLETFTVAKPAAFVYQEFNGWQRFSSGQHTFVALRTQQVNVNLVDTLQQLVQDAGAGVTNFSSEPAFPFALGGHVWQRINIEYMADADTPIWGTIMARLEGEQTVVAWAEAPAWVYDELETAVFLTMIADLDLKR